MRPRPTNNATNFSSVRRRGVPDVPEDVDFLMEHLNDPNFDYYSDSHSFSDSSTQVFDIERKSISDAGPIRSSEFDTQSRSESMRYSAASKLDTEGTVFEYNELVYHHLSPPILLLTTPHQ